MDLTSYNRIALSGYHGAGKTTLAKRLVEITNYEYIPEVARDLLKEKTRINKKQFDWRDGTDYKILYSFENAIFWGHLFFILDSVNFIVDRTVFDVLAYSEYQKRRLGLDLFKFGMETLNKLEIDYLKLYDCILFYRNGYELKKEETQLFVDKYLEEIYSTVGVNVYHISRGDVLMFKNYEVIV